MTEKKTNPILWQTEAEQQLADAVDNMVRAIDAIKDGTNKDDEYLGALASLCMVGTNLAQAYGVDALGVGICWPVEIVRGKPASVMECGIQK